MKKRKNPRLVKAILSLPISNVREILTSQALHSKILSDKLDLVEKLNRNSSNNILIEVDHIENRIDSLRDRLDRYTILFSVLFALLFIVLMLS